MFFKFFKNNGSMFKKKISNNGKMKKFIGIKYQLESHIKNFKNLKNFIYIYIIENFNIKKKQICIFKINIQIKLRSLKINYLKGLIKRSDANKKKNENL
jgi:hypothetical protein